MTGQVIENIEKEIAQRLRATEAATDDIDKASVWSDYGNGYGFVPLVLPFVGLWWLWRVGRRS